MYRGGPEGLDHQEFGLDPPDPTTRPPPAADQPYEEFGKMIVEAPALSLNPIAN